MKDLIKNIDDAMLHCTTDTKLLILGAKLKSICDLLDKQQQEIHALSIELSALRRDTALNNVNFYTSKDLAEMFNISDRQVRRLLINSPYFLGKPLAKKIGRDYIFTSEQLPAIVEIIKTRDGKS